MVRDFEMRDAAIDVAAQADEVVLWFEHDLFDQLGSCAVAFTDFGHRVLSGRDDHPSVNGLDRWVGGVRLCGTSPRWRVAAGGVPVSAP